MTYSQTGHRYDEPLCCLQFQALPGQITWSTAEDELLAAGMMRHGLDYVTIQQNLLPMKTTKEAANRQKNRCHRVERNCIRVRYLTVGYPAGSYSCSFCTGQSSLTVQLPGVSSMCDIWPAHRSIKAGHMLMHRSASACMLHAACCHHCSVSVHTQVQKDKYATL